MLVSDDPRDVVGAIELSWASYRKMIQNLVWATGYNALAIPVAAGLFAPWGIVLPLSMGAVAMSVSTMVVAANAQLLRRLRLRQPAPVHDPVPRRRELTRVPVPLDVGPTDEPMTKTKGGEWTTTGTDGRPP